MPDKVVIRLISKKSLDKNEEPKPKEVIVYHWNRIFGALLLALALAGGLFWGVQRIFHGSADGGQAVIEPAPAPKAKTSIAGARIREEVKNGDKVMHPEMAPPAPAKPASPAPALQPKAEELMSPGTQQKEVAKPSDRDTTPKPDAGKTASPVISILSENIKRAQLTSNVVKGEPVDSIGPSIPMNDKGLVRVYLFMETSGLKGKTLFHDWYWKGKRMAHARVPIKRKDQTVASSKFIDRIMMGSWEVKVVDIQNTVLVKTGFEVR